MVNLVEEVFHRAPGLFFGEGAVVGGVAGVEEAAPIPAFPRLLSRVAHRVDDPQGEGVALPPLSDALAPTGEGWGGGFFFNNFSA